MLGTRLCAVRPRFARRSRFVALLSLFAAFTAIAATTPPLAPSAAFTVFPAARRNGLALVDRRDRLVRDRRLLVRGFRFARRPLLLAFASTLARLVALTVARRLAIATLLLRLPALGLL